MIRFILAVLLVLMLGCQPSIPPMPSAPVDFVAPSPVVLGQCHSSGGLPDPQCTPGVTDPAVTQDNLATTICKHGYSATVRPPTSYTEPLKLRQMAAYGYSGQLPALFELDHALSLEAGGSPTDPRNLWPEAYEGPYGARVKDRLENVLHQHICAGSLTLAQAQQAEMTNWIEAYRLYVGPLP